MCAGGSLEKIWNRRLQSYPFYPLVELTERGLMFGAGTSLARLRRDESGAAVLDVECDRERILALLAVVYGRPLFFDALRHIEGAVKEWRRGDKALANIRLAYARFPRLERREEARPLFIAAALLKAGVSPRSLMKQYGFDPLILDFDKYVPSQPRVPPGSGRQSGRWTSDGAATAANDQSRSEAHSTIHLVAEDLEQKKEEDQKALPEAERRALRAPPRKEDVEEGHGIRLQTPLVDESVGTFGREIAGEASEFATAKGAFSINDWAGYPSSLPKPTGPFRVLEGEEYNAARAAANKANRALRESDPDAYAGKQLHEMHPVKFGGSPTDPGNKIALSPQDHFGATTWWDRLLRYMHWDRR